MQLVLLVRVMYVSVFDGQDILKSLIILLSMNNWYVRMPSNGKGLTWATKDSAFAINEVLEHNIQIIILTPFCYE